MGHHVVPLQTNIKTLLTLIVLTGITVYTAKYVDLGEYNLLLAMFIASVKATVVLGWFMHLKYDGKMNRAIALCGIAFLALFLGFSYLDLNTRDADTKQGSKVTR
jgi:cytochrome c oxidase subunit 4